VEGDWPDFQHINDYVKGRLNDDVKASDLLHNFRRWPTWMWANWETAALADWMKRFNAAKPPASTDWTFTVCKNRWNTWNDTSTAQTPMPISW
jgi:erythromycin esterase-like protein